MLAWRALRATVPTQPVVFAAPVHGVRARVPEGREDLAGKAVVADGLDGALDASFVARMPHPRRIDVEAARLRVLEKRRRNPWR
jgi:hypothetical protein